MGWVSFTQNYLTNQVHALHSALFSSINNCCTPNQNLNTSIHLIEASNIFELNKDYEFRYKFSNHNKINEEHSTFWTIARNLNTSASFMTHVQKSYSLMSLECIVTAWNFLKCSPCAQIGTPQIGTTFFQKSDCP